MTLWPPWITGHRRGQRRLALSRCPDDAGQLPSAGGDVVVRGVKREARKRKRVRMQQVRRGRSANVDATLPDATERATSEADEEEEDHDVYDA